MSNASLASWKQASEFSPGDRGGPYVVLQDGYDPEDPKVIADEFVLGRSGKWLSLGLFYRMPVPERRAEFVFGTAAEVMEMIRNLPSRSAGRPAGRSGGNRTRRAGNGRDGGGAPGRQEQAARSQRLRCAQDAT